MQTDHIVKTPFSVLKGTEEHLENIHDSDKELTGDKLINYLAIKKISFDKDRILYEIPAGKVVYNQSAKARFVDQSALKGNTCYYYTMNFIRDRIGKNPKLQATAAREMEILCSNYRKGLSKMYSENIKKMEIFKKLESKDTKNINIDLLKTLDNLDDAIVSQFRYIIINVLSFNESGASNEQIKQYILFERENYIDSYCQKSVEYHCAFLTATGNKNIEESLKSSELSSKEKIFTLINICKNEIFRKNHLQCSDWTLTQGFEGIKKDLLAYGPLIAGGKFGRNFYENEPKVLQESIAGRDIYAWEPGSKRKQINAGHTVLIIGVESKNSRKSVFFIDCNDPSRIGAKTQKIYKISYKNFEENLFDNTGFKADPSTSKFPGYFYHADLIKTGRIK